MRMQTKKHRKSFLLSAVLIGSLALAGCLEDFGVTLYEPGVYKGAQDSQVILSANQQDTLRDRLPGQNDR